MNGRDLLLCPSTPVVRAVLEAVCQTHSISVKDLVEGAQERRHVSARRAAVRVFAEHPYGWSLAQIGRALGGMHHTSVRHLLQTEDPKPRCRPQRDIGASAAGDLEARIREVEERRQGLRARLAELDATEAKLRKALCALANAE